MKMIAACPKCKTRFKIDESKMAGAGVKLRCSKCRTVFAVRKKAADTGTKAMQQSGGDTQGRGF
ncbi:MAG: zinc-ribbon domain-containing protein [Deltaproteobacteria bacterium]|nr:zinc-ribbon domain-containing protein [Deltaproteobacteria bacterium]